MEIVNWGESVCWNKWNHRLYITHTEFLSEEFCVIHHKREFCYYYLLISREKEMCFIYKDQLEKRRMKHRSL